MWITTCAGMTRKKPLILGIRLHVRAYNFFKQFQHLPGFSMAAKLLLGIKQLIVHLELKCPLGSGNKRKLFNDVLVVAQNIIRHTDGACRVVSRHAIFEGNRIVFFHRVTSVDLMHCELVRF